MLKADNIKLLVHLDTDVKVGFTGYKEFREEVSSQAAGSAQVIVTPPPPSVFYPFHYYGSLWGHVMFYFLPGYCYG